MPSKEPTGEINIRYCSACSTSFDVDEEGVEGQFGIIPVAFCSTCRVGVREMAEVIWDLVPREEKKPYEKPEIRELSVKEIQELCTSGWRSCIDHIIKPEHPCPVCRAERLTAASKKSEAAWRKSLQYWRARVEALEGALKQWKADNEWPMWYDLELIAATEQENKCAFCGSSEYPHICEGALNALQAATEQEVSDE